MMSASAINIPLLNEKEMALMLRVSVSTLRRWRANRAGPNFVRIGSSIRYLQSDIQTYLDRAAKISLTPSMSVGTSGGTR